MYSWPRLFFAMLGLDLLMRSGVLLSNLTEIGLIQLYLIKCNNFKMLPHDIQSLNFLVTTKLMCISLDPGGIISFILLNHKPQIVDNKYRNVFMRLILYMFMSKLVWY